MAPYPAFSWAYFNIFLDYCEWDTFTDVFLVGSLLVYRRDNDFTCWFHCWLFCQTYSSNGNACCNICLWICKSVLAHHLFVSLGEPVQRPAILINTFKEFCFCLSRYFRFYCNDFISNVYYVFTFQCLWVGLFLLWVDFRSYHWIMYFRSLEFIFTSQVLNPRVLYLYQAVQQRVTSPVCDLFWLVAIMAVNSPIRLELGVLYYDVPSFINFHVLKCMP